MPTVVILTLVVLDILVVRIAGDYFVHRFTVVTHWTIYNLNFVVKIGYRTPSRLGSRLLYYGDMEYQLETKFRVILELVSQSLNYEFFHDDSFSKLTLSLLSLLSLL
jgi:hypothetical protein